MEPLILSRPLYSRFPSQFQQFEFCSFLFSFIRCFSFYQIIRSNSHGTMLFSILLLLRDSFFYTSSRIFKAPQSAPGWPEVRYWRPYCGKRRIEFQKKNVAAFSTSVGSSVPVNLSLGPSAGSEIPSSIGVLGAGHPERPRHCPEGQGHGKT